MSKLRKRTYLLSPQVRREYAMAKAFLAPQREHVKKPMPARKVRGMNAVEHLAYLDERRQSTPLGSLRWHLYCTEGVEATDSAIRRGLAAWAVERRTGLAQRQVTVAFGKCRSDALRRASAPARLGEPMYDAAHVAVRIESDWDEPFVWPIGVTA